MNGLVSSLACMLARGASLSALAAGSLVALPAVAQTTPEPDPAVEEQDAAGDAGEESTDDTIVVTGSRIDRAGFDQPTPTTVFGEAQIEQSARQSLQMFLADQPQVRPTNLPTATFGSTTAGTAAVDLRGLGSGRTLVLLNGRRFVGEGNINFVPTSLVKRLDIVTGGASAAYGSGAVAGVVNIILDDDLEGLSVGGQTSVSSRGDGEQYSLEGSFGTSFASGDGHFMVGAEYLDDRGIPPRGRLERNGTNPGGFVTASGERTLYEDINGRTSSEGGLITSGVLAGQVFNHDGTLRPFQGPDALGRGGADASSTFDHTYLASPSKRLNAFARASYDLGSATVWAEGSYGKVKSHYVFFHDFSAPPVTVQATNPFLSQIIRDQLAAAGQTSFTLGRLFTDILPMTFNGDRESIEGAIGINGSLGGSWNYRAHYSHGEIDTRSALENSRLEPQFARALQAVSSGGQIVCAVNADASTANDDPACRPLNIFGQHNASQEAIDYVTDTQATNSIQKLDSTGFEVTGSPFSLWAGDVSLAAGVEARWEKQATTRDDRTLQGGFGLPVYTAGNDIAGKFDVREVFGEMVVPLLEVDAIKAEFNGAARYSDYSTSGGIWTWKAGGTIRLFDDLLLRATRSRDIRSPSIDQLFAVDRVTFATMVDQNPPASPPPGYTATPPLVATHSGGNPLLTPEISKMWIVGATYSPSFLDGLRLSVDYYDIKITDALGTLGGSNLTLACRQGQQAACDRVVRDPATQTVTEVFSNTQNIAEFATSGIDMEVSYITRVGALLGDGTGTLTFRALGNYIRELVTDNGLTRLDNVGTVGDLNGSPPFRGIFTVAYQEDVFGLNARVRHIDGGKYDKFADGLRVSPGGSFVPGHSSKITNNDIDARTYVDIGAQIRATDKLELSFNVTNLFDVDAPISPQASAHYEVMGTYFNFGVKVDF
jgi:iron complex outermembrane receptor protein